MDYLERVSDEDEPRNAAAIRTALLIGAKFVPTKTAHIRALSVRVRDEWRIEGEHVTGSKTHCAWMYLVVHGICIDKDAKPIPCSEMRTEDNSVYIQKLPED